MMPIEWQRIKSDFVSFAFILLWFFQYHKKWLKQRAEIKRMLAQNATITNRSLIERRYWVLPSLRQSTAAKEREKPFSIRPKTRFLTNEEKVGKEKKKKPIENDVLTVLKREEEEKVKNKVTTEASTTSTTTATTSTTPATTIAPVTTTSMATTTTAVVPTTTNSVIKAVIESQTNSVKTNDRRQRPRAAFGKWKQWTMCSRTCGGGIMSQARECLKRYESSHRLKIAKSCWSQSICRREHAIKLLVAN